jgi:hypothetical protein
MIRHFVPATFCAGALTLASSFVEARQAAQLMVGDPSGANVAFAFGIKVSGEGLRIEDP